MARYSSDSSKPGAYQQGARRPTPHRKKHADSGSNTSEDSAAEGLSPEELEALKSFRLEVSAGRKLVLQRIDNAASQELLPRKIRRSRSRKRPLHHSQELSLKDLGVDDEFRSQQVAPQVAPELAQFQSLDKKAPKRTVRRQASKKRLRQMPSWGWSLAAHLVILLLLSYFSIASFEPTVDFELHFTEAAFDDLETLRELELDSEVIEASLDSALASSLMESFSDESSDLTSLDELAEFSEVAGELEGDDWNEQIGWGSGAGDGLTEVARIEDPLAVTFFGARVEGRRIVFVLDNSGGMRYGQFETLVEELLRSVHSLSTQQQFYVIFYSDTVYPLFYPQATPRFVAATDRNKQLLQNWLDTVEFCMGNEVDKAMAAAESIRPDVVYLLTDGDLDQTRDQRRIGYLLNSVRRSFSIHTIGMGVGPGTKAAEKLQQVAEANGGTYRAVDVSAEAKQLARTKNRPYHNEEPGRVWGIGQKTGWGR